MKRNPMNVKTKQQTLLANAILTKWEKYNYRNKPANWTVAQVKSERKKVDAKMKHWEMGKYKVK